MDRHERAMLAYAKLAAVSQQKNQLLGRDKLLVLAGAAACRAGWPDVAAHCRRLVLERNPTHLVGTFGSMADALRNAEFQPLLKQLERQCSYERAEHLVEQLEAETSGGPEDGMEVGRAAETWLNQIE